MGFSLPYFPMYAAETLADGRFQLWSLEERGAWVTLLLYNWNDGSIPAGASNIARLLHIDNTDANRIWSSIGDRFIEVPGEPGRLHSPRLEEERAKAETLGRMRAEVGRKGATARWNNGKKPNGKRMPLPSVCHGSGIADALPGQCPSPSSPPPPSPNSAGALPNLSSLVEAKFPGFWALYSEIQAECPGVSIPKSREARESIEADVARLGLPAALAECRRIAAKAKEPIGNMAFFVDALNKARRGTAPVNPRGRQPVGTDFSKIPEF